VVEIKTTAILIAPVKGEGERLYEVVSTESGRVQRKLKSKVFILMRVKIL
jgi:hypothetical protein